MKEKGGLVAEPNSEVPLKNETLVTVAPLAVASATISIFAGAVKTAPLAGLVIDTDTEIGA